MKLTIGYLYGDLMNIYGDTGNVICLQKRAEWRGIEVKIKKISVKDSLKQRDVDIFFFGGGQDQSQQEVAKDLGERGKGEALKQEIERGIPLLSICGGYQLLGEYYQPFDGPKLEGVGLFKAYTQASNDRMIGNIVVNVGNELTNSRINELEKDSNSSINQFANSLLVGFENHSGKTYLKDGAQPLGKVIKGYGNNGEDKTEGCVYKNALGCYMHGSLLPKNPHLADWLLKKALEVKYEKEIELEQLNDKLEIQAHEAAVKRFI